MGNDEEAMKLILLNNCYPNHAFPQIGTYAKTIAERLEEAGHDVRVVALNYTRHKAKDYMRLFARLAVMKLPSDTVLYINHYVFLVPLIFRLMFVHRRMICHWHGEELVNRSLPLRVLRWIMVRTFRKDTIHISPSRYYAGVVERVLGIDARNIIVSPSGGVDTDVFKPYGEKTIGEVVNIGYAAALSRHKGMDYLMALIDNVDELEQRLQRQVMFHVIDYGKESAAFREYLNHSPMAAKVIMYNRFEKNDLPKFYANVALSLFLSKRESLGLTVIESMACNVPVIARDLCAMPEMIVSGVSGELVSREPSQEEIFEAICKIVAGRSHYEPRKSVIGKYDRLTVVKKYQEMFGGMEIKS